MRGVIGFAFALPLCIHIGCTFDPIGSLWLWWFWSLWCSICICTTFFISIVELGSSSFFYYNDRICPHWLYFWVPLTNLMVTGWTLENYRILSMLFLYLFHYCKLHLLSYALTVIQVKSLYLGIVKKNVTETVMKIVFPWYSPCGACYWRWLHLFWFQHVFFNCTLLSCRVSCEIRLCWLSSVKTLQKRGKPGFLFSCELYG